MNQSPHDSFRPKPTPAKNLSTPHLRALRKELLIVRADVERAELVETFLQLRNTVTHFSWLRFLIPKIGKTRSGPLSTTFSALVKQYPLVGSLLSLVLAKPLRSRVISTARPLIKWAGVGFTAWEAYRIWQQMRRQTKQQREPAAARTADTVTTGKP